MSDQNFVVENSIARYIGLPDPFDIARALYEAMELAKTHEINEFRFSVSNAAFDVLQDFFRLVSGKGIGKGIIEPEDNAVVVRYTLVRHQVILVNAIGEAQRSSLKVPEPIDLAARRIV